jgi:hypothetical protein
MEYLRRRANTMVTFSRRPVNRTELRLSPRDLLDVKRWASEKGIPECRMPNREQDEWLWLHQPMSEQCRRRHEAPVHELLLQEQQKGAKYRGEFLDVFGDIDGKSNTRLSHPAGWLPYKEESSLLTPHTHGP